ncbi:hypothetical protein FJ656_35755, partial [Schumannella luteola]
MGDARGRRREEIEALTAAAFRRDATAQDVAALRSAIGPPAAANPSEGGPPEREVGDSDASEDSHRGTALARRPFLLGIGAGLALAVLAGAAIVLPPVLRGEPLTAPQPSASASPDAVAAADPSLPSGDAYGHGADPAQPTTSGDGVGVIPGSIDAAGYQTVANDWNNLGWSQPGDSAGAPNAWALWVSSTADGGRCYMAVERDAEGIAHAATECLPSR